MKNLMAVAAVAVMTAGSAHADGLVEAFKASKPLGDARLRMEDVDQDPIANDAEALTLRARLGFETGKAWNTSLLIEGEGLIPIQNDYRPDSTIPTMTTYPVVADAETYEINRFQFQNTSLPGTTITLGRQRILLDDQRFIGNSGWRQNEQTFDALRVVNKSLKNFTLDATYLNRVNRVNGPDSPQGVYRGDTALLNVSYQTKAGKLTGFGYLLDFENIAGVPAAVRDSTSTYGVRFAGEQPLGKIKLGYSGSYAQQTDYADNPLDFDLDSWNLEGNVTFRQFGAGVGIESLAGNGVKGFTTPLASLHKFQGWADKFIATPPNGIEDKYLTLSATLKRVGPVETLGFILSLHEFDAERSSLDYGDELDVSATAKIKRFTLLLKYANFHAGALASARDTEKLWAQVEFLF